MTAGELRLSFAVAWLVISLALLVVLIAPFLLSPDALHRLSPECLSRKRHGTECPLCGMTRAFALIARGRLGEAHEANQASPALCAALLLNQLVAVRFAVRKRKWLRASLRATFHGPRHAAVHERGPRSQFGPSVIPSGQTPSTW